jgi:hypothetical protein
MAWKKLTNGNMPVDGEIVLVSNGTDIALAEFVQSDTGPRLELVTLPTDTEITHWQPISVLLPVV